MAKNTASIPTKTTGSTYTAAEFETFRGFVDSPGQTLSAYSGGAITIDGTGTFPRYTISVNTAIAFATSGHVNHNVKFLPLNVTGSYTLSISQNGAIDIYGTEDFTDNTTSLSIALTTGNYLLGFAFLNDEINVSYAVQPKLTSSLDVTAPQFVTASFEVGNVADNIVILPVDEALDPTSVPAVGDFAILVDASPNVVTNVDISTNSSQVRLTLTTLVTNGQTVTAAYTKGVNPLRDTALNETPSLTATAVTNNVAATNALLTNLVSYYGLGSEPRVDAHGLNDLTRVGNVVLMAESILYMSSYFPGDIDYLLGPTGGGLGFGDNDFSISGWIRMDDKIALRTILAKWNATDSRRSYALVYNHSTDRFTFYVSSDGINNTNVIDTNVGSPLADTWYHVVGYHDSVNNEIGISVNAGTPDTAVHSTGVLANTTDEIAIGAFGFRNVGGPGTRHFGYLDEIGIWNKVLTPAEISILYNSGNGFPYTSFQ